MHFLDWTLAQQGEPGTAGALGRLLYTDINNGCGVRFTSPIEWNEHFSIRHSRTQHVLSSMLSDTYEAYLDSFNAEK
jgi:hypothetical protein